MVPIRRMHPVESSAVNAIAYDARSEDVYVEFVDGDTYAYSRVPPPLWHAFEAAPSKGRFVNLVLKPRFACRKV